MNRFHTLVLGIICAAWGVVYADAGLAGKWQGTTPSGRPIVLDAKVAKQVLTGTISVAQQSADITDGKVEEQTFSFVATIEGRTVTFSGRRVGEQVELTPTGAAGPVTLKRVK